MSARRFLRRAAAITIASAFAAATLVACSGGSTDSSTIRIGTTEPQLKSWKVLEKKAKDNDINIKLQAFSDYNAPNRALSEGQLDANLFQHLKFLAEYNTGAEDDLTPVGSTQIVPLAIYWKDHSSLDKVKVTPVNAAQTTSAYGEGRPAIINNSFLERAGIDPTTAVFKDNPDSPEAEPYINVFVTKADKQDDEKIAKLVELWHDPEVIAANQEDSKGTAIEVNRPKAELKDILKRLEEAEKK